MFTRRRTSMGLLPIVLAVVIVITSCAADDAEDGNDVAASVIATVDSTLGATETPPDTEELPEGCRVEQTEDEYGFPVDVVVCDDGPVPTTVPPAETTFVEWAGSDAADALSVLIRDALVIHGGCAEPGVLRELDVAAGQAPDDVRESLERVSAELAQASTFCGVDPVQWESHLRVAIASLEEFVRTADAARVAARQAETDG